MRRREFICLIGAAGATWPLAVRAQQPATPVIGYLDTASASTTAHLTAAFREGLSAAGYEESRNVMVEYRWPDGDYDKLPSLAADLVRRRVAVIVAGGAAAYPAKAATNSIPIVFSSGSDPVQLGLVASLNRPGGNATGTVQFNDSLITKRLELLRELVPMATVIGVLADPRTPTTELRMASVEAAARSIGQRLRIINVTSPDQFEAAFVTIARERIAAILVPNGTLFTNNRERLVALAAHYAVPAGYEYREFVQAGGLFSYGSSNSESYKQVGIYVGRILKGENPAEMPVVLPTKFDLVLNLKTAKALGLTVPPTLSVLATEVIE